MKEKKEKDLGSSQMGSSVTKKLKMNLFYSI